MSSSRSQSPKGKSKQLNDANSINIPKSPRLKHLNSRMTNYSYNKPSLFATKNTINNSNNMNHSIDNNTIKRNDKGGVLVLKKDIEAAFQLLDSDNLGYLNISTLKKKLSIFFPDLTIKDYKILMNEKKELVLEDLIELLVDNDITNYDPVFEAFKCYDINNSGFVDTNKLKEIFSSFGFGKLNDDELDILVRTADIDCDGLISLEDFRMIIEGIRASPSSPKRGLFTPKSPRKTPLPMGKQKSGFN